MNKLFSLIIPLFKPNDIVLKSIQKISDIDTIIVNNSGETNNAINNFGEYVFCYSPGINLGYAAGANRGLQITFEKGAEWGIVINQDLSFSKHSIEQFISQLSRIKPGVAGPYVGSLDSQRWTTILPGKQGTESCYISGSCIAIHKDVYAATQGFYEPYFMYYEDADLSIRAKNKGFTISPLEIDGLSHIESQSLGQGSRAHEYYLARNHLLFVSRLAPSRVRQYETIRLPKTMLEAIAQRNTGAVQGIYDYFRGRFGKML